MPNKPIKPADDLSPGKRQSVHMLLLHAFAVHGVQFFTIGLGAYLAIADGRGWPPVIISVCLALWMQTQLPVLPDWLERMRPEENED